MSSSVLQVPCYIHLVSDFVIVVCAKLPSKEKVSTLVST